MKLSGPSCLVLLFMIFSPVMACYSISDLGAVEMEIPVNMRIMMRAQNFQREGDTGLFRSPADSNVTVIISDGGIRLVFPMETINYHRCTRRGGEVNMKDGCLTMRSGSGNHQELNYRGDAILFEARKACCSCASVCEWDLSLEYEVYPETYILECLPGGTLEGWSCSEQSRTGVEGYDEEKVKQIVNETLHYVKLHGVIQISEADLEEIVKESRLGNSGHNSRLVYEGGSWKPYHQTENPSLVRGVTLGGCGEGETIVGNLPEGVLEFSVPKLEQLFSIFINNMLQFLGRYPFKL
ncbi:MAG TPA: hypothetical protein ENN60_00955 [archaeon]|nr:hypothetical protein [archaeon]